MDFSVVLCTDPRGGIGWKGRLPWHHKHDMHEFKRLTWGATVIMGRKTRESLPAPLENRRMLVVSTTRTNDEAQNDIYPSLLAALEACHKGDRVFVIGGAQLYQTALTSPYCRRVYWTQLYHIYQCDTFVSLSLLKPMDVVRMFDWGDALATELTPPGNKEEQQYLHLVKEIIETGPEREDRTGVGTKSLFGRMMRFDLSQSFPLLTTKRVFWRGVKEELLWFISGSTNAQTLSRRGVKIWDANGSREQLDALGLTERAEYDLGPIYSFQWRHFGATYVDCHTDYTGQGVDQLADVIHKLKHTPTDRRIVLSAWNPRDLPAMALPPCHMFCQFYVQGRKLSCQMYQRSCDMGLGVPFNIASYALLTCTLAHCCNLEPGEFIHVLGDAHVYVSHVEALKQQCTRQAYPFPRLTIRTENRDIDGFQPEDFVLQDYVCHPALEMPMAV